MKLEELGISRLVTDSRKVMPGDTFVAYRGDSADGRDFIGRAIEAGASSILWEKKDFSWNPAWNVPNLAVENLREKSGEIADRVYGRPSEKLWVIGVTGTNGKTSCTHWIAQSLTRLGKKTAVIGTLGNGFPGNLAPSSHTTPDAVTIHGFFSDYLNEGAQCVAMEVSSHALAQGRVNGVRFDVAMLTNLTRDHLDYHGDMDAYAATKARLFGRPELRYSVLNADDSFGFEIMKRPSHAEKVAYGLSEMKEKMQVRGKNLRFQGGMLSMDVESSWGRGILSCPATGRFNASNMLGVLGVLLSSGYGMEESTDALSKIEAVPGRMEQMGGREAPLVVVDYAHTPDALENVLNALREIASGKLICVFGCGGDRDRGKRPVMGKIASRLSDRVVVTSDNPRSESPEAIIKEIVAGMDGHCSVIPDRAVAIRTAIHDAEIDDLVLIAGKGHEDYQEIKGKKFPFSDRMMALESLRSWGARC